mmetsp:Transcript_2967/g.2803  ORF Transcript_2967/g.2803 Transcript_2967/m.2803 type:complete len:141 (+) Transcript_2967:215-637(+)|eukprot:CAMPEP_0170566584 /NCGR_PEP_ID=MMETSP0211-20121228/79933_1 /TAXON_ID=311385 /ORGANISM="Pseudokeronopsis sp., Strain OXSARD2" /LENGTH=140 /DNA_ID=CAMNT_0010887807 /DNA_START=923 /DNA_END=1345 /DNA_ORIENTATION=-
MLEKNKKNRPLITDLLDFLQTEQSVIPLTIKTNLNDYENYNDFNDKSKNAFEKKRLIEGNLITIKNDFSALKNQIVTRGKSFKAHYLNYKGSVHANKWELNYFPQIQSKQYEKVRSVNNSKGPHPISSVNFEVPRTENLQ